MNARTPQYIASTLIDRPLPFSDIDINDAAKYSSLFFDHYNDKVYVIGANNQYYTIGEHIYSCKEGFGEAYGKPFSRGGEYVTINDLRILFALGVQYGRRKLMGWRPRWNEVFSNSMVGYPKLSRLVVSSGKTMISKVENNPTRPPEDGKENEHWTPAIPKPVWASGFEYRSVNYDVEFTLPTRPQTFKKLIGSFVPNENYIPKQWRTEGGMMYMFERTIYALVYDRDGERVIINELLGGEGNMRLKISKYDDIYTNESHKDMYVEVLSTYHIKSPTYTYIPHQVDTPNKTLPLKNDIRYYLYLEYDEGCRTNFSSLAHDYTTWRFYFREASRALRVL